MNRHQYLIAITLVIITCFSNAFGIETDKKSKFYNPSKIDQPKPLSVREQKKQKEQKHLEKKQARKKRDAEKKKKKKAERAEEWKIADAEDDPVQHPLDAHKWNAGNLPEPQAHEKGAKDGLEDMNPLNKTRKRNKALHQKTAEFRF